MFFIHELKIDSEYADSVFNGSKSFEVRLNDRNFAVGDFVHFSVNGNKDHPLNHSLFGISYILEAFSAISKDYVVFSIKKIW